MAMSSAGASVSTWPQWRPLAAAAGTALAALEPARALGGRTMRARRKPSLHRRGLALVPFVAGVLALAGAVAWRRRARVAAMLGRPGSPGSEPPDLPAYPGEGIDAPRDPGSWAADEVAAGVEAGGARTGGATAADEMAAGEPLSVAAERPTA